MVKQGADNVFGVFFLASVANLHGANIPIRTNFKLELLISL